MTSVRGTSSFKDEILKEFLRFLLNFSFTISAVALQRMLIRFSGRLAKFYHEISSLRVSER